MRQPSSPVRIAALLLAVLLTACGVNGGTTTEPTTDTTGDVAASTALESGSERADLPVEAVATTTIIADLVSNVGGERVNVRSMLPPGTDPHTYSPTPGDVQAVAEADMLFQNGLGLEEWLQDVIENAGGTYLTVTVSDGLEAPAGDAHHHKGEHADEEQASDHGHDHGNKDPHMWFDMQKTIGYVENIRDGLKQVDPAGASIYDENAAAYIEQLNQLDQEIMEQVESIPPERRKLVSNHDTFGYFAERYGLEIVGTVFEGMTTEQEPSAQQVAQLVEQIREQNVPAIFTETTVNPRLAEQIAEETGVEIVSDLYTDALGEPGSPGETYTGMIRYNVERMVEALSE